jgi:hypothetical protein
MTKLDPETLYIQLGQLVAARMSAFGQKQT